MSPKKRSHSSSSSSSSSCHKNLIKLYSSVNFDISGVADTKPIRCWDINDQKIEFSTKFISNYTISGVIQYFKANVNFTAYKSGGQITKHDIVVRDIAFKNQVNVSASSQTDDYNYLYDISKSSADNSSSTSTSSSSYSISEIINKNVENQIATAVKNFYAGTGVIVSWAAGKGSLTLDVEGVPSGFDSAKLIAKYRFVHLSSSSSSSSLSTSTSCSSASSSTSSCFTSSKTKHDNNKILVYVICALVGLVLAFCAVKICKPPKDNFIQGNELLKELALLKGKFLGGANINF